MIELTAERIVGDKKIIEFSRAFLQFLAPVNERFPVDFFRDLQEHLVIGKIRKDEFNTFKNLCVEFVNAAEELKQDILWTEALLFFCLYILDEKLGGADEPWPDGFNTVSFQQMAAPSRLVCNKLLNLYKTWADCVITYPCAKPYAFYLLMEAVIKSQSLLKIMDIGGNEYFPLKEYFSIMNDSPESIIASDNELTRFAKKFRENQSILSSASPFDRDFAIRIYTSILEKVTSGIDISHTILSDKKLITTLVVGLPRSGKTVMIKTLFESANRGDISYDTPLRSLYVNKLPVGNEIASYLNPSRPQPNVSDSWELEGDIHINKNLYNIIITDTRGGTIAEPPRKGGDEELGTLEKTLIKTDLLLIVLDPTTLLNPTIELFNGIGARIKYLMQNSKHAMISIVLTKFDEYGVVLTGPRSLINNERKWAKLKYFQNKTSETSWNDFVDELLSGFNDNQPLQLTLRPLLQKLRPLFSTFCITHGHIPINIYVINAIDAKDAISFQRTGIPFIFDDFEAYISCLIDKFPVITPPPPPPPNPVENLIVAGEPNNEKPTGLKLSWNVVPECRYSIRRKFASKNGAWTQWKDDFAPIVSTNTYTDRLWIQRGCSYQYEVKAINIHSGQSSLPAVTDVFLVPKMQIPWALIVIIVILIIAAIIVWAS